MAATSVVSVISLFVKKESPRSNPEKVVLRGQDYSLGSFAALVAKVLGISESRTSTRLSVPCSDKLHTSWTTMRPSRGAKKLGILGSSYRWVDPDNKGDRAEIRAIAKKWARRTFQFQIICLLLRTFRQGTAHTVRDAIRASSPSSAGESVHLLLLLFFPGGGARGG